MTACTNHGGKARRVVTAALVGVLSVGTVPMAALAEGVSDAISPLFAEGTEFTDGYATPVFTADTDGDGELESVDTSMNSDNVWEVSAEHMPLYVSVSELDIPGTNGTSSDNVDLTGATIRDYKIRVFNADEEGEPTGGALSGNKVISAGEYVIVVDAIGGTYAGQTFKTNFVVKGIELPKLKAIENSIPSDTTFVYSGSALDVDFLNVDDGTAVLEEGVDYEVSFAYGSTVVSDVEAAGLYSATLTGLGKYAGSSATVPVNVEAFDLSKATAEIDPFTGETPKHPSRVYYTSDTSTTLDPELLGLVPNTGVTVNDPSTAPYDFIVTRDPSVTGTNVINGISSVVPGYKVDKTCTYQYNGSALQDSYELDASKGETFNTAGITALYGSKKVTSTMTTGVTKVTFAPGYSQGGRTWSECLSQGVPGEYEVKVNVPVATDGTDVYGGTKTFKVKIYKGVIDADKSLYVYAPERSAFQPVAITSYAKGYDGELLVAGSFDIAGKGINASDFDSKLVDANGNEVDSAINAGEYKLVVTSDWYKLSGTTELPITIAKVDLDSLEVGEIVKWNVVAGEEILPTKVHGYAVNSNASAIGQLGLVYATGNDGLLYSDPNFSATKNGNDFKGQDFIPECVDVVVEYNDNGTWKEVGSVGVDENGDEMNGEYRVTVTVSDDVAANFIFAEGENSKTVLFSTAQKGAFKDVQPSYWAYNVIQAAWSEGYMNGTVSPTNANGYPVNDIDYVVKAGVFNPEGTLTRAQVAAVLFNASGADMDETDAWFDENYGWKTGFSDVDGKQWYGEAITWAKQSGVINGYADGTFQADKPVTREEFISMLANYAKVVLGDDTVGTVDAGVLADFPDGSKVTDWAEANVAWAAEKGIIGNGGTLMPTDTMTRAYCAAMMVNYLNPELAK